MGCRQQLVSPFWPLGKTSPISVLGNGVSSKVLVLFIKKTWCLPMFTSYIPMKHPVLPLCFPQIIKHGVKYIAKNTNMLNYPSKVGPKHIS